MSFSFTEPTATHPVTETTVEETQTTVEETTNDTSTDSNGGGSDADKPGDGAEHGDEDAGGNDPDGEGKTEETTEEEVPPGDKPEQDTSEVSHFFGGEEVSIEVDPSHREAFESKGLDIDKLAAELYAKDGEFKLSDESYKACCDAFGKFAIDALISGLKAQNEQAISGWKHEAEARVRADEERFTGLCADIGGAEGWTRLEEFALETLSDTELAAFNEVMASGNQYLQQYAVRELEGRRKGAQGDDSVNLIEGNAMPAGSSDTAPLNARDYIKATAELGSKFPHDKAGYAKAQAALDARRRAGQAAGL
ncbi:MAG: hypothetical protein ACRDB3_17815 [Citrobacter telavivensis]